MKLRKETIQTGHLLAFISKQDATDNFSIFFPVRGLEQFDSLLKITRGFELCSDKYRERYDFVEYSIADFGRIEESFQNVDRKRLVVFDPSGFLDSDFEFVERFGRIVLERLSGQFDPIFPNIVTGANATGTDFYDRRQTIEKIFQLLDEGENILFRAPRRYGKSSLLKHIEKYPPGNWHVCYIDLEGGKSCEDFVEQIFKGLLLNPSCSYCLPDEISVQKIGEKPEMEKMDFIRQERSKIRKNWKAYAENLFKSVNTKAVDKKILLVLDEVSFLIEDMMVHSEGNKQEVRELLLWFREIRKEMDRVQLILTGSEHLPTFLQGFGIDEGLLSDLKPMSLELFDPQTAVDFIFLTLAGQKIGVVQDEINHMLSLIGKPIPYFLQLFLDAVCRVCRERQNLTCDDLTEIYYQNLLGADSKRYFESIQRQLDRYRRFDVKNSAAASRILNELANNEIRSLEQLQVLWQVETGSVERFDVMMGILQDDFYIRIKDGTASFDSKLLKDWWNRHVLPSAKSSEP